AQVVAMNGGYETKEGKVQSPKTVEVLMNKAKQVYNTPDKGILWGWEVSAYVWTKAISAGMLLIPFIALLINPLIITTSVSAGVVVALFFLTLTGILLVMDLDQPKRFAYVLLRPHWSSWLVKGGYAITIYGALLTLILVAPYLGLSSILIPAFSATGLLAVYFIAGLVAVVVATYTAFLFAQAKGRDFWQSPTMAIHMLVHSLMAGISVYNIIALIYGASAEWMTLLAIAGFIALLVNLGVILIELKTTHPTQNAKTVVQMILHGRYKYQFWFGAILLGNIIPIVLLLLGGLSPLIGSIAGALVLTGIYFINHIWVEAPQRIALS
ncbi:MAG: NrfD/PsrC family molybdoenzyme membrane anchor subunit, partial [Bacteroidota bacterium]